VYLDVGDLEGLAAESEDAVSSGFQYKACIHPTQVPIVRYAYAPAPERIDWAQRVLAAAEVGPGVFSFEGHMIDRPVLRQAQMVLQRAHT
jgi:citrate lyase subunit beta/citryl-CoA lyase